MGTILASAIVDRAEVILQDAGNTRWNAADLLAFLNEGKRALVAIKPSAYVVTTAFQLAAGTKQSLPSGSNLLIGVRRNMGTNGTTPGRVPDVIPIAVINRENPNWHTDVARATVEHVITDENDPTTFYVYPPQPTANQGYLEMARSANPPDATSGAAINVDDCYEGALVDYILHRAYSIDADYAREDGAAAAYLKSFVLKVTGREGAEDKEGAKR